MQDINQCEKAFKTIHRMLYQIEYECRSSVYILTDEEMSSIFYCRDLAEIMLKYIDDERFELPKWAE